MTNLANRQTIMDTRSIIRYICTCLFIIVVLLRGVSCEVVGDLTKNVQMFQSSREMSIQEDQEEAAVNNAGVQTDSDTRCPIPRPPEHGFFVGELVGHGSVLYLKCHDGYRIEGPTEMACLRGQSGVQWTPDEPSVCVGPTRNEGIHQQISEVTALETVHETELRHPKNTNIISPGSFHPQNLLLQRRMKELNPNKAPVEPTPERVDTLLPSHCLYEPVAGHCGASIKRYYFNKSKMECYKFIYSGCDGNSNNFETITDCNKVCLGHK